MLSRASRRLTPVLRFGVALGVAVALVGLSSCASSTAKAEGGGRAAAPTAASATAHSPPGAESLDTWLDTVRARHDVPALGAIVFRADSILARGVAGVRRADATAPVEEGDRFQLGSNTKAITATVLATLVEEGQLAWTTTLADVFPELRDAMSPDFRAVTIELLLSHHAGLSAFDDSDAEDFRSIPRLSGTPMERRAAFTAWVLSVAPASPVGGAVLYSNGGYTVAAAVAERVTGESWESLVRSRVFEPLGLAGAFAWSEAPDVDQPWGHYETPEGLQPVDPRDPAERVPPIIWPAGAVELSLADYARFLQLHLRGLEGRDTPLLNSATIAHLHTSPVQPPDAYGLGWGVQDFAGARSSVHVGSAGAFYAITIIQPTRDLGVAVFANAGGERATAAVTEAAKALVERFGVETIEEETR